ncbi:MAG: hypothetical protein ACR652_15360 [Methylocystis sp.]|uniref:hypothetical protein n=1 Tax=Methylocystis sp. TaxID=1911079 RepID=UPI003DA1E63A
MTKEEAERVIRHLVHKWAKDSGINLATEQPSFSAFQSWLHDNAYSHYLSFRSANGAQYDAQAWFDQELRQTSRN